MLSSAQDFAASGVNCSLSCMETVAVNKEGAGATKGNIDYQQEYTDLYSRLQFINTADSALRFTMVEAPAKLIKGAMGPLLGVGGAFADLAVDKGLEALKEYEDDQTRQILRRALKAMESQRDWAHFGELDGNVRLARVEDTLRKLKALNASEDLFDNLPPDQKIAANNHAIQLLTTGLDDLKRQVVVNTKSVGQLRTTIQKLHAQVTAVSKTASEMKEQRAGLEASVTNATSNASVFPIVADNKALQYAKGARDASGQLAAAAGILAETGNPDAARMVNVASGAMQLASGIAMCYVNPTAILPTVLSGIQFLRDYLAQGTQTRCRR